MTLIFEKNFLQGHAVIGQEVIAGKLKRGRCLDQILGRKHWWELQAGCVRTIHSPQRKAAVLSVAQWGTRDFSAEPQPRGGWKEPAMPSPGTVQSVRALLTQAPYRHHTAPHRHHTDTTWHHMSPHRHHIDTTRHHTAPHRHHMGPTWHHTAPHRHHTGPTRTPGAPHGPHTGPTRTPHGTTWAQHQVRHCGRSGRSRRQPQLSPEPGN